VHCPAYTLAAQELAPYRFVDRPAKNFRIDFFTLRLAERNVAEVEHVMRRYFKERDSLEAMSRDELLE
jgi:hypothetical protein